MLLFNNSVEFDETDHSFAAHLIPMKLDTCLKDIWIPDNLLPNRRRALDADVIRPSAYRILEKPNVEDRFSVYSDQLNRNQQITREDILSLENRETDASEFETYSDFQRFLKVDSFENISGSSHTLLSLEDVSSVEEEKISGSQASQKSDNYQTRSPLKPSIDNQEMQSKTSNRPHKITSAISIEDFEDDLLSAVMEPEPTVQDADENLCREIIEGIVDPDVPYQKTELSDGPNKKSKKEKKVKNKKKKNVGLNDFLQIANSDGYEEPERHDFYESLQKTGGFWNRVQVECPSQFPALLPESSPIEFVRSATAENNKTKPHNETKMQKSHLTFKDIGKTFLKESLPPAEAKVEIKVEPEVPVEEVPHISIAIENIPKSVSTEDVKAFLMSYEGAKNLRLKKSGKFLKAKLEIDSTCDVDWIIEVLNDCQPFGACEATLKCYKLGDN